MPIPIAFTITALIAVVVHSFYLRRVRRREREVSRQKKVGLQRTAIALVGVEITRLFINLVLVISGIGILIGFRSTAYLIAFIPLLSIVSSFQALRRL